MRYYETRFYTLDETEVRDEIAKMTAWLDEAEEDRTLFENDYVEIISGRAAGAIGQVGNADWLHDIVVNYWDEDGDLVMGNRFEREQLKHIDFRDILSRARRDV
jgi:hypothetical protein